MSEVWSELRRRNVFRVAVAYAVMGWVLLQVASLIAPALGLPGWAFSFVLFVLIIGFPLALIFAWAFELTPEGLKRTGDVDPDQSVTTLTGRKVDFLIIGVLSVALVFFIVDRLFVASTDRPSTPQEVVRSSIAVLPFVNMSNDPDQVYFSDGISEEILNVLGQIPDLHVTSRSSAFQFRGDDIHIPDVAQQLGVANILEGSVRKSGSRIRITAQLIDASTDSHLWTHTYDRELTDIFAIQDEISKAIVDALHIHLGLERPAVPAVRETDAEAYRLYLLGRHNFEKRTQDTLYEAIEFFDQAIAIDATHAPAWSGKADAYMLLRTTQYGDIRVKEALALAEPLIEEALRLNPDLAEAHASKGLFLLEKWQVEAAISSLDRAISINPNLARAWHWMGVAQGFNEDHIARWQSSQRAHLLDPLSPVIVGNLFSVRMALERFDEAKAELEKLRQLDKNGRLLTRRASEFQFLQGNWANNLRLRQAAFSQNPNTINANNLARAQGLLKAVSAEILDFSPEVRIRANRVVDKQSAWEEYMTLPQFEKDRVLNLLAVSWTAGNLGKYDLVIETIESMPDFRETFPGPLFSDTLPFGVVAPMLALARLKTGDKAGAERLLVEIERYIAVLKEQGATLTMPILEAELLAIRGEGNQAITALEQAHTAGYLFWYFLDEPFYENFRDRNDFQALVRSVDDKVNEERAKLGWDPVE